MSQFLYTNYRQRINISELLERDVVPLRTAETYALLQGRVVLVTGAAGSIGSELCRLLLNDEPACLLALDNNETGLFDLAESVRSHPFSDRLHVRIGDITDMRSMRHIFAETRPHIVFHAAAYKHVPLLEKHPVEAIRTNVLATYTLCQIARESDVERFVFISSDKAAEPVSVLGASKRLGELIVQAQREQQGEREGCNELDPYMAQESQQGEMCEGCNELDPYMAQESQAGRKGEREGCNELDPYMAQKGLDTERGKRTTHFSSVRFGNVMGSRGSVIPVFAQQIEQGGPVTVTHPDATRYFMTIPEACGLVILSAAIAEPGGLYLLDMGSPIRILDLATRMIRMQRPFAEKDISIVYTGLRPGERLHEKLVATNEVLEATDYRKIFCIQQQTNVPTGAIIAQWMHMLEDKLYEERPEILRDYLLTMVREQVLISMNTTNATNTTNTPSIRSLARSI